ncbi:organic cation transporter protein isoform X2 [Arctopsyche grandis]
MSKQPASDGEKRPSSSEGKQPEERDPIAECIGNYGLWQLKTTFLLSLCSFPCTFHIFAPTFLAAPQEFWCARPNSLNMVSIDKWRNFSQSEDACQILDLNWSTVDKDTIENGYAPSDAKLIPCTHWEYDKSIFTTTIISEWNLVCDRASLNTLAETLFLAGIGAGGVVSGMISDRFGRKKTMVAALFLQTLLGLSITLCPWYELYLVQRVILGFFSVAVVFSAFVLVVELVGGKWRTTAGVCNFFPLPVSYILVSGLSLAFPEWRHLQLAVSLPGFLLITLWWVVPESPQWLLTMGRIAEVKEIMKEAAAFNKRKLPPSMDKILQPDGKSTTNEKAAGVMDLFRGPTRKITICVFIAWFATTIAYYGLVLNISSFGGDLHTTSALSGLVEIPAIAISIPVLLKMGRRYPICLSMVVAGIGCAMVMVVDLVNGKQWIKIAVVMLSKFAISATNGVLPMFTAELYPTLMRNLGVGASQVSAGIGLILIPYLWKLATVQPMLVTGIIAVLGGLCVLLLPETANKSLTSVKYDEERRTGAPAENTVINGPYTITEAKAS